jgi:hypothetical protein
MDGLSSLQPISGKSRGCKPIMNKKPTPSQTPTKENRLLNPLVRAYERFLRIRGQPREIALGFALGLFVGMTPFMGLQTVIAVPLAALLQMEQNLCSRRGLVHQRSHRTFYIQCHLHCRCAHCRNKKSV